ncbi:VOC family protein [Vibrio sp. SM6]|uniref:VOC family protein n=1 Tax=Vibrio agarilyticus TaxID=2726741 RepID=A0A7X8TNN5_9VIBR|nr:VOC family protein [Vibrio agarilyticus]NLS11880.1 VOC family protein [Vibrio agarilyticus]
MKTPLPSGEFHPPLLGLDHIVLRTDDITAMRHFYQTVLGCVFERALPHLGLTQLRAGSALIDLVEVNSELGRQGGKSPSQNGRNMDHFCLTLAPCDEAALLAHLRHHHIPIEPTNNPFIERYGAYGFGRSIYIRDPQGNVVELKPLADSSSRDTHPI